MNKNGKMILLVLVLVVAIAMIMMSGRDKSEMPATATPANGLVSEPVTTPVMPTEPVAPAPADQFAPMNTETMPVTPPDANTVVTPPVVPTDGAVVPTQPAIEAAPPAPATTTAPQP